MSCRTRLTWLIVFTLPASAARAQVALGEELSLSGSADVFFQHANERTSVALSQYQLEIDYDHEKSGLFSHVELEGRGYDVFANDQADKNQFRLEAAFLGYHFDFGLDLKVGRFISPSGYEGAEPWRRFTRLTAFGGIFSYLHNGVALQYKSLPIPAGGTDLFLVAYGSFMDGAWTGDVDLEDPSFEALVGFDWGGLSFRADLAFERINDNGDPDLVDQNRTLVNVWAQYTLGPLAIAAEYNRMDEIAGFDDGLWSGDAALLFAKFSFTRNWALGLRGSFARYEDRDGDELFDSKEIAVTPRWQIFDRVTEGVDWDVRADVRFQIDTDAIQGFEDGVIFELGTTFRY